MGLRRLVVSADGRVRSGWVVLAFALIAGVVTALASAAATALGMREVTGLDDPRAALFTWPMLLGALAATLVCRRAFDAPVGLERSGAGRQLALGVAGGVALVALACVGPMLAGVTTLRWGAAPAPRLVLAALVHALAIAPTGLAEELLLRGVPLRALARGTHPVVAVLLTSLTFGALHLTNPNASPVAALVVALVGVWFGAAALRTGSLWAPIGLHVGWNFGEGFVFGQPVSGLQPGAALLEARWPAQAGFWSGGDFGPEAAGWTAALLAGAVALTMAWPRAKSP
jgi:membrane protease YdiL (CAAX protease family)